MPLRDMGSVLPCACARKQARKRRIPMRWKNGVANSRRHPCSKASNDDGALGDGGGGSNLGVARLAADGAVVRPALDLDVAHVSPVRGPAVPHNVVVLAALRAVACERHGVVDLAVIVLARLDVQDAAVIVQHLVRHHDADGERALRHEGVEHRVLVPRLDVDPARDLRAHLHGGQSLLLAVAVQGEVAAVGRRGGEDAAVLPDDLQRADVRVPAVAAHVPGADARAVGAVGPRAVHEELLGELRHAPRHDRLPRLDGLREAVGPAGAADGLILYGAHAPRPRGAPVEALGQLLRVRPVRAHKLAVLRQAPLAGGAPALAAAEAHDLLPRHVEELVAPEGRPARVPAVELPDELDVPLEDLAARRVLPWGVGLAVLPEVRVEEQRVRVAARGRGHAVAGLEEVLELEGDLRAHRRLAGRRALELVAAGGGGAEGQEVHGVLVCVRVKDLVAGVHVPAHGLPEHGVEEEGEAVVHGPRAAVRLRGGELLAHDAVDVLIAGKGVLLGVREEAQGRPALGSAEHRLPCRRRPGGRR
mmetsp:Transcript_59465/g.159255  ORF Transcript_59465/g.159255 Transcript_59465/m.159255 type:complete len:533 (+) Transcript_59465:128-1726(+)